MLYHGISNGQPICSCQIFKCKAYTYKIKQDTELKILLHNKTMRIGFENVQLKS